MELGNTIRYHSTDIYGKRQGNQGDKDTVEGIHREFVIVPQGCEFFKVNRGGQCPDVGEHLAFGLKGIQKNNIK